MFVVFEGIDGSGKTTLSNLVAARLRDDGLRVEHVREGGRFASSVTQAMRELGRDARNLALTPRAELMLYLGREIQLLEEATRPALARADVVIADRFVYTAEVLAVAGRGLASAEVAPLVAAAAGGLVPDLVVLVDVDPHVARARRRVAKIVTPDPRPPSRKGQAGAALPQRLRRAYRDLADRHPDRWIVVDNTDAELDEVAGALVDAIRVARLGGVAAARAALARRVTPPRLAADDVRDAAAALSTWIERRAAREPGLAAYFLAGLAGAAFDPRRQALAARAPAVIAWGLRGLADRGSWELRHALRDVAPAEVARSLIGPAASHGAAGPLLRGLARVVPRAVADALFGRDDGDAWAIRSTLSDADRVASVGGVAGAHAWLIRSSWLAARGGLAALADPAIAALACASVEGVAGAEAWEIRRAARTAAPVDALAATTGLLDDRAWKWRERRLDRAPRTVMRTIAGLDDARAWSLRGRVADRCEEAIDSIVGLDAEPAWRLREAAVPTWPSSVVRSLGGLAATPRGDALIAAAFAAAPASVALWRHALLALGRDGGVPW